MKENTTIRKLYEVFDEHNHIIYLFENETSAQELENAINNLTLKENLLVKATTERNEAANELMEIKNKNTTIGIIMLG